MASKKKAMKVAAELAAGLSYSVDGETVSIDRGDADYEVVAKVALKIADALGAPSVTSNGSVWHVWYKRPPTDLGDYNNPTSKWHY